MDAEKLHKFFECESFRQNCVSSFLFNAPADNPIGSDSRMHGLRVAVVVIHWIQQFSFWLLIFSICCCWSFVKKFFPFLGGIFVWFDLLEFVTTCFHMKVCHVCGSDVASPDLGVFSFNFFSTNWNGEERDWKLTQRHHEMKWWSLGCD